MMQTVNDSLLVSILSELIDQTSDWTNILAIFIAFVAVMLSATTLYIHRNHMRLSVRPIPILKTIDKKNLIEIFLFNRGSGTMFIKSLQIKANDNSYPSFHKPLKKYFSLLGNGDLCEAEYGFIGSPTSIFANDSITLLIISLKTSEKEFLNELLKIRKEISNYKIIIEYSDIYDQVFEPVSRSLDYFAKKS